VRVELISREDRLLGAIRAFTGQDAYLIKPGKEPRQRLDPGRRSISSGQFFAYRGWSSIPIEQF
jgi:hypothetical protein